MRCFLLQKKSREVGNFNFNETLHMGGRRVNKFRNFHCGPKMILKGETNSNPYVERIFTFFRYLQNYWRY